MPINLTFYKFAEKQPKHGEDIWLIDVSQFYGTYEFTYGDVEYGYEELDQDGNSTGTSFSYEEGETAPENCKLYISFNGENMQPNDLWAYANEISSSIIS